MVFNLASVALCGHIAPDLCECDNRDNIPPSNNNNNNNNASNLYIIPSACLSARHRTEKGNFCHERCSRTERDQNRLFKLEGEMWEKQDVQVKSLVLATEPHLKLCNISRKYSAQPLLLDF